MKEITKQQVIELMDKINMDGIDNSNYDIVYVMEECEQCEVFVGGDHHDMVEPGTYCVVYSSDTEFDDVPFTRDWINSELDEENIDIFFTECGIAVAICLDNQ